MTNQTEQKIDVDFDALYIEFNKLRDDRWYRYSERQAFEMAISKMLPATVLVSQDNRAG